MKELITALAFITAVTSIWLGGYFFGVKDTTKISISKEVCIQSGLVIYKGNKCTTKEWASEQANKLIEK